MSMMIMRKWSCKLYFFLFMYSYNNITKKNIYINGFVLLLHIYTLHFLRPLCCFMQLTNNDRHFLSSVEGREKFFLKRRTHSTYYRPQLEPCPAVQP